MAIGAEAEESSIQGSELNKVRLLRSGISPQKDFVLILFRKAVSKYHVLKLACKVGKNTTLLQWSLQVGKADNK